MTATTPTTSLTDQTGNNLHYHVSTNEYGEEVGESIRVKDSMDASALCHDYIQALASMHNATRPEGEGRVFPERSQYSPRGQMGEIVLEWSIFPDNVPASWCRVIACDIDDDEDVPDIAKILAMLGRIPGVKIYTLSSQEEDGVPF